MHALRGGPTIQPSLQNPAEARRVQKLGVEVVHAKEDVDGRTDSACASVADLLRECRAEVSLKILAQSL